MPGYTREVPHIQPQISLLVINNLIIAWGKVKDLSSSEWSYQYTYPITFNQYVTLQLSVKADVLTWIVCQDGYNFSQCNLRSNTYSGRGVIRECFVLMIGY